jgi:peptide/nickel transport system substrate-binding protein
LLKEAQYDGTPIVLLHSTDFNVLANLAPIARQLLERAGFTVDLQSMDWQTRVTRRIKKNAPHLAAGMGFLRQHLVLN